MKRSTLFLGAILCLLACAPFAPASAKDKWTSVRSKNFVLVGNASEKDMRKVATRLEQFRDVFTRLLKKANFSSATPTTVVVFKDYDAYRKVGPSNTTGYFQASDDMNYIALSTLNDSANDPFKTIFHEFVHFLIKNNMQDIPVWFNEGLAEYYSTFEIKDDDRRVMLGRVLSSHVFELRERKLIPLQTLFTIDHTSSYYNESNKQSLFYAESWALVHYLLLNPERQPQLGRFLNLLLTGTAPDKAFPVAFGTDYATLEKELKEYVRRDSYPSQVATFEQKLEFDLEMQSTPLSDAEGEFYLGDLLNHSGQLAEAEKHLQKALALDPELAIANASLGMLEMRRAHYAEARRYLERAIAARSDNYLVHYYYAYVMTQELLGSGKSIMDIEPGVAQKLRAELKQTIELAPNFAEAYRLLGFINLVAGEELDESIKLLQHAMQLMPGEQEFGFILAQIFMRKHDYQAARELLEPIVHSSGTRAELRTRSQYLLDSIKSSEESLARYKSGAGGGVEVSGDAPPPGAVIVLDENEQGPGTSREEGLSEMINQVIHQPQAGEVRVRGQLLRIDCGNEILFSVQTEGRAFKLTTKKFESIKFISYLPEYASEITCGVRKPVDDVVIIYKPFTNAKGKAEGEVISVEFVPKNFKLKQ